MIKFNGHRLKQAREILGLTQVELAEAVHLDQSYISFLEQNARDPSAETVELISLRTGFPKSYFQQPDGPDFPEGSLLFRKKSGLASVDASAIRQTARLTLELFLSLQERFKRIPMRIPQVSDADPVSAAKLARSSLGYSPDGPIKALMSRLEKAGVLVVRLPVYNEGFDAFSAWSAEDEQRPIIALGHSRSGDRDRATMAHELCHLVMHSSFMGTLAQLEKDAAQFAGEFLLPEPEIAAWFTARSITLTSLAELKSRSGVSMQFILQRLEILGTISPQQKSYWRGKMHRQGWLEEEPIPIPPETPRLLRQVLESIYGAPIDARNVSRAHAFPPKLLAQILEANGAQTTRRHGKEREERREVAADDSGNELAPVLSFRSSRVDEMERSLEIGNPEPFWPSRGN